MPADSSAHRAMNATAKAAWDFTQEVRNPEYSVLVRRLPMMLLASGLGQTMAFLYSRKGAHATLLLQIAKHLWPGQSPKQAMDHLVHLSIEEYRLKSREAMRLAEWMKRFVGA